VHTPRIVSACALTGHVLRVDFEGRETRDYDVGPLLSRDPFTLLKEPAFFRSFVVERDGHAIVWNDEIDLAAYELFRGGRPAGPSAEMRRSPFVASGVSLPPGSQADVQLLSGKHKTQP
jgi:hypothetical protein